MAFDGRTVQSVETRNYGGIAEHQNPLNISGGFALDMDNWEIDGNGGIQVKAGMVVQTTLGSDLRHFDSFFKTDGTQIWVAVSSNKFYEANDPAGPWTDRTGSVVFSSVDGWIGAAIQGKYVLGNGVDPAIYFIPGSNAQTLKNASLLTPPQGVTVQAFGTPGGQVVEYAVTALTARGETLLSNYGVNAVSVSPRTAANYNVVQWVGEPGAQGYTIYVKEAALGAGLVFFPLGSVGALVTSYSDTGQVADLTVPFGKTVNMAYNTPAYWDAYPPKGFAVVARGQAQRIFAWRDIFWWASSLSDPLDWFTPNNAFSDQVYGGDDNTIQTIGSLFDYTVFFTKTNTFIYVGNTYSTWAISRMLHVGCGSPDSLFTLGNDLYFWSEFGPATLSRIQAGAEVQSDSKLSENVKLTVNSLSNRSSWSKIVGFKDILNNRVGWAYPNGTSTGNDKAILYDFTSNGWSRHSIAMPNVANPNTTPLISVTEAASRQIYGAFADGSIAKLYSGNTDNGVAIAGYYETGWYDSQSSLNRYISWLDVFTDKTRGNYTFTVSLYYDFSTTPSSTHTLTQAQTDGIAVAIATSFANAHRLFTSGMGRYFKFKFNVVNSTTRPAVRGWRPEMRAKGTR